MTVHEYKLYCLEKEKIKRLLIDNPFNLPQIVITIETDIMDCDGPLASELLLNLDSILNIYAPQASNYLTLRHHSPFLSEIFSSDSLQTLLNLYISVSVLLIGITPLAKSLWSFINESASFRDVLLNTKKNKLESDKLKYELDSLPFVDLNRELNIKKLQHEADSLKSQQELKMLEIEKMKREIKLLDNQLITEIDNDKNRQENTNKIILQQMSLNDISKNSIVCISDEIKEHILTISFSIRSDTPLPKEFRQAIISREAKDEM